MDDYRKLQINWKLIAVLIENTAHTCNRRPHFQAETSGSSHTGPLNFWIGADSAGCYYLRQGGYCFTRRLSDFLFVCLLATSHKTTNRISTKLLPGMCLCTRKSPIHFERQTDQARDLGIFEGILHCLYGKYCIFCWQLTQVVDGWDISLATKKLISVLIRITMRIKEFFNGILPLLDRANYKIFAPNCIINDYNAHNELP